MLSRRDALGSVDPPLASIIPPLRCTARRISLRSVEVLLDLVMLLCGDPQFLCALVCTRICLVRLFLSLLFSFALVCDVIYRPDA